jgi:3-oxoacyl-[acyl-carrier protein] reductase|tara:strand:- start:2516 stop:3259 length:744 start_codon:yes stop_codon:yes gene_type:complete
MLLKNKTAVITGSNKGIGFEILKNFSENGANIFACTRNIDDDFISKTNTIKEKYNNTITPIEIDLSSEIKVKEAANQILNFDKPIDILINNAGIIQTSLFQMSSRKKLNEIFEINFFSQTIFTQFILKSMIKQKSGSIIYISSSASLDGNEGRSSYAASKAALNAQAKVLSRELGGVNIRVNTIAPGLTNTDMMSKNTPKNIIEETISKVSLKRFGEPEEIAKTALYLASDLSSYITGQIIRVDGGM